MNMQAYKADTAWNQGIPGIFFKILIQLYLLCSFIYSLTYWINEVIRSRIFRRLNKIVLAYDATTAWNRGISSNFFHKTDPIVFIFFIYIFLTYYIKEGIKVNIFGHKLWKCLLMRPLRPETGESLAKV